MMRYPLRWFLKLESSIFAKKTGFLFDKYKDKTACQAALAKYGKDKVVASIKKSLPSDFPHPIMHHFIPFALELVFDMTALFPDASGRREPPTGLSLRANRKRGFADACEIRN